MLERQFALDPTQMAIELPGIIENDTNDEHLHKRQKGEKISGERASAGAEGKETPDAGNVFNDKFASSSIAPSFSSSGELMGPVSIRCIGIEEEFL